MSDFTRERTTRPNGPSPGRRLAARMITVLAALLVLFALLAPNSISRFTLGAFASIPIEGLLGVALLLLLPPRPRRIVAALLGVFLGLLVIVKILDMGFYAFFDRPFDLVLDWSFLEAGQDFVASSYGRATAAMVLIAVGLLIVGVLAGMTLAVRRLTRVAVLHRDTTSRAFVVLGVVWATTSVLGAHLAPGVPVAGENASALVYDRAVRVNAGLGDRAAFEAEAAVDAFRYTPGEALLTGLRGKDVLITFVESYGRSAVEDPLFAPQINAVLSAGDARLRAAGYSSRSGFLTSPTATGGSWLAHATLLSGLWIDNQQRYDDLVKTDRLTLNAAFRRASWRTTAVMPGIIRDWPEGNFFGYDKVYSEPNLGYRGPRFSFATMPDQYTLSTFQHAERARTDRAPVMAEIALISSHAPWEPVPRLIDWAAVGDGSVYESMAQAGDTSDVLLRDPRRVRADYRTSIEYSLNTLLSYVETYGDDNLVLVVLGDHQPAPIVVGERASRDVPITVIARDPAVLDRVSGWGWTDGLKPDPGAPVWRMDAFRDQFLTAFGPTPHIVDQGLVVVS